MLCLIIQQQNTQFVEQNFKNSYHFTNWIQSWSLWLNLCLKSDNSMSMYTSTQCTMCERIYFCIQELHQCCLVSILDTTVYSPEMSEVWSPFHHEWYFFSIWCLCMYVYAVTIVSLPSHFHKLEKNIKPLSCVLCSQGGDHSLAESPL